MLEIAVGFSFHKNFVALIDTVLAHPVEPDSEAVITSYVTPHGRMKRTSRSELSISSDGDGVTVCKSLRDKIWG